MKATLLGFSLSKQHQNGSEEYGDWPSGYEKYSLYFKSEDGKILKNEVTDSYGSCYSGYTSASWGHISNTEIVKEIPQDITPAKEPLQVLISNDYQIYVSEKSTEHYLDALIREINSVDGTNIAYETGDGGCRYYSSGVANINKELFQ